MPKTMVIVDELHVTLRIPVSLPDAERDIVLKVIAEDPFRVRLQHAIRRVIRSSPELARVRATLSR